MGGKFPWVGHGVGVPVKVGGAVVGHGGGVGGGVGVGDGVGVGIGVQMRNRIDALLLPKSPLATARSCLPSALKSPTATENGPVSAAKLVAALKLPTPSPNRTDTLLEARFATTRSCLPSPLKSPMATDQELLPAAKLVAALKLPAPSPNRTETLPLALLPALATARSCSPSPLKSPTAADSR